MLFLWLRLLFEKRRKILLLFFFFFRANLYCYLTLEEGMGAVIFKDMD